MKRLPDHEKFLLVLKLYRFGEDSSGQRVTTVNRLNRMTGVAHQTIRNWKKEGFLDISMELVKKAIVGDLTIEDINQKKAVNLTEDELADSLKPKKKVSKDDEESLKEDKLLQELLFSNESELKAKLPESEKPRGNSVPGQLTMTEFPSSDMVFHEISFYTSPRALLQQEKHSEFMSEQMIKMKNVVDMALGQLEGLVKTGKTGSKSAEKAIGIVKEGLAVISKYQSEGEAQRKKFTPEELKQRSEKSRARAEEARQLAREQERADAKLRNQSAQRLANVKARVAANTNIMDSSDNEDDSEDDID